MPPTRTKQQIPIDVRGEEFERNSKEPTAVHREYKVGRVAGVKGKIIRRKKPFLQGFAEAFLGDDVRSVMDYIIQDVLIPAAKSTLADMVAGGVDRALFGSRGSSRTFNRRDPGKSIVSYSKFYDKEPAHRSERRESTSHGRKFDDLVFGRRVEAESILETLIDMLEEYEQVSLADLYDAIGVISEFADQKWGWTNLSEARVSRVRDGGYMLNMPDMERLD